MSAQLTPDQLMSQAINKLMRDHPFYASMLLRQKLIWDEAQPTGYTDGIKLGTNTEFLESLTLAQRITYLAHEVLHVCLLHHTRRNGRDLSQWNKACDYAINIQLLDTGFEPLPRWLCKPAYRGMTAEAIYRDLQKQSKDQGKKGGQNPLPSPSQGNGTPKKGTGQPANGIPQPDETGEVVGEVRDAPNPQEAEQEAKRATKQASTVARRAGKLSEGLERALGNTSQGGDPRELLAAFLTERAQSDYTMSRPHRKYIIHDIYQPSIYNKTLGRFAVACDTSGSISAEEISKLVAFVFSVLNTLSDYGAPHSLPVIYCDAKVKRVEELEDGMQPHPIGGGGTDFAPPFQYIEESGENIVGMIYITDGWGSFPKEEPPYPVVWALLREHKTFTPPFGDVVEIFNMV